jgi:hypothetical protein
VALLLLLLLILWLADEDALLALPHNAWRQSARKVVTHIRAVVQLLYFRAHKADRGRHDRTRMLLHWVTRAAGCPDVTKQR